MTKGWRITDASGNNFGTQAWDDNFGPVLRSGQLGSPFSTAGAIINTGTFVATGQTASASLGTGFFNASVWGTFVATIQIERSFDGGTTWVGISVDGTGTVAQITSPASFVVNESEVGVLYRMNCTAYTSGTVNWRISK